ncbi:MAG TPA: HAD family hydrolase [Candidatus Nanoarchaeia archaeon]|nr:HAD family hydrolase [Candidatus Nanoarchaeia archaeon]
MKKRTATSSHLVLFDIDGTLTNGASADPEAMAQAFRKVCGVEVPVNWAEIQGMTAQQVFFFYVGKWGLKDHRLKRWMRAYVASYKRLFPRRDNLKIQPGARALLTTLKSRGCVLGNVTGNFKELARFKLKSVGLRSYFKFGAYGDDAKTRAELVCIAIKRGVKRHHLHLDGDKVVHFGDTPRDVIAGKKAGIQTVAVATGVHSVAQLRREKPDLLVTSLDDKRILKFLRL